MSMKPSLTDYLYVLAEDDFDKLHEIFSYKYRKFITAYWLLKDFSDYIVGLKYKDKVSKNTLILTITVAGMKSSVLYDALQQRLESFIGDIDVSCPSKTDLLIKIHREEEEDVSVWGERPPLFMIRITVKKHTNKRLCFLNIMKGDEK